MALALSGQCIVKSTPLFFPFPSPFLAFPRMKLFNSRRWEALNQTILLLEPSGVWHISCRVIKQETSSERCKTLDCLTRFHRSFQSSRLQTPFCDLLYVFLGKRRELFSSGQNPQKRIFTPTCVVTALQKTTFSVIIFTSEVLLNKLCCFFCFCVMKTYFMGGGKKLNCWI